MEVKLSGIQLPGSLRALSATLVPKVELQGMVWSTATVTRVCDERHNVSTGDLPDTPRFRTDVAGYVCAEFFASSVQRVCDAGATKLIALSASAVIVKLGFTPRFAPRTDPSHTYIFR